MSPYFCLASIHLTSNWQNSEIFLRGLRCVFYMARYSIILMTSLVRRYHRTWITIETIHHMYHKIIWKQTIETSVAGRSSKMRGASLIPAISLPLKVLDWNLIVWYKRLIPRCNTYIVHTNTWPIIYFLNKIIPRLNLNFTSILQWNQTTETTSLLHKIMWCWSRVPFKQVVLRAINQFRNTKPNFESQG